MRLFRNKSKQAAVKMATTVNDCYYAWSGNVYSSDIVRACIAPKVKAIGKLVATHVRTTVTSEKKDIKVNPDVYMRFLLEEPNPYMSGQKLQERMAAQMAINKNAFALIVRDENGLPSQIYPIPCNFAQAVYDKAGELFIQFTMVSGDIFTFPYRDIIHISEDVNENSIFGTPIMPALAPLMEVVTTTDQGIVKAIKNSAIIRWLLKFTTSTRDEDIEKATKRFANAFLSVDNGTGVAGVDAKADAIQIHPDTYTPNAAQMNSTEKRIYALFNTNPSIVTSDWSETQWAAYFEAEVEPVLIALQNEFTRKLFTRRERGCGNRIVFDASGIDSETTATKLSYVAMVDRRSMTPNEWREKFHWAPVSGGDELIFWQAPNTES